jgi:hypothetical protein
MALSDRFTITKADYGAVLNRIIASGDFNGDGWTDFLLAWSASETPQQAALGLSRGDGSYVVTTEGLPANFKLAEGIAVAGDFTGDGRLDIAVFDGVYDWTIRNGKGVPPVLLAGDGRGAFSASDILAKAVLDAPKTSYLGSYPDADLAIKAVAAGDIDGDGDLDLWIESTGADNITNHFMVNRGGSFAVEPNRIAEATLVGDKAAGDYFRYGRGALIDLNGDGYDDLVLGQIRDNHATHIRQTSYVVYNDRAGNFPQSGRVVLPLPDFYFGYTSVEAIASGDLNGDGRPDLILSHTRNDDVSGPQAETAWQGRYLQVLIADGSGGFRDETTARLGDQAATRNPPSSTDGNAPKSMVLQDVDHDGDLDIVMGAFFPSPRSYAPAVMLNTGDGRFVAMDANYFTDGDQWWGEYPFIADINGDGRLDMVHLDSLPGPNGVYDGLKAGSDDTVQLIVQVAKGLISATGTSAGGVAVVRAAENMLRLDDVLLNTKPALAAIAARRDGGTLTDAGVIAEIVKLADQTTSVATLSYLFFTGKIPGAAGIDYLVSASGPNPNNLNSAYFQNFNLENRYINFAVNLGKDGEGKAGFAAEYGSLSLFDATKKAYAKIFGAAPTDAQVTTMLSGGRDAYFASYGGDGLSGQGTKAAMVGWLLAEAEKADLGVMARSNAAWLTDLADGSAPFAIDITAAGAGYYKSEFVFGG